MISRYEVYLDNRPLSEVGPGIFITDIKYDAPDMETETFSVANRQGSRIWRRSFKEAKVTVKFWIREYNPMQRQSVCSAVAKWAKNGGILKTNDRDGQFLQCVCDTFPYITSAHKWTDELTVAFKAYTIPFWQEIHESKLTLTGSSKTGTLYIPGNADGALVAVKIKANASVSSVALGLNGKTLTLSGLSLSENDVVNITYNDKLIQSIKKGSTSLLDKRTGADDLIAKCGEDNSFSVTASASVTVDFTTRGLWL